MANRLWLALMLSIVALSPLLPAVAPPAVMAGQAATSKARILVHVTHGPEAPTRAALAFLVAKSALDEGHTVSLFLAGDAVQLIRDPVLDSLTGLGTGKLRELYDAIVRGGGRFYMSGMSSNARKSASASSQTLVTILPRWLISIRLRP